MSFRGASQELNVDSQYREQSCQRSIPQFYLRNVSAQVCRLLPECMTTGILIPSNSLRHRRSERGAGDDARLLVYFGE